MLAESDPAVDRALAGALPSADAMAQKLIVVSLLSRSHSQARKSLIVNLHRLSPALAQRVLRNAPNLTREIRLAMDRDDDQSKLNAVRMVEENEDIRLASVVADLLRHASAQLRERLGLVLCRHARAIAQGSSDTQQRTLIAEQVVELVKLYRHHEQPSVLEAMLELWPITGEHVGAIFDDPRNPATTAMQRVIQGMANHHASRYLFELADYAPLRVPVLEAISQLAAAGQWVALLSQTKHPAGPAMRRLLHAARPAHMLVPDQKTASELDSQCAARLPAWIDALNLSADTCVAELAKLLEHQDQRVRMMAMHRLAARHDQAELQATATIADAMTRAALGDDNQLARIALNWLIADKPSHLPKLLTQLASHDDPAIRTIATRRLAPVGFARAWASWPDMSPSRRLTAGKALLKIDRQFHAQLASRLQQRGRPTRLRALGMIQTLNQGEFFEQPLIQLLHGEDEVVAASAAAALGTASTDKAKQALTQGLDHADARVRGNCVEALESHAAVDHVAKLVQMAQSDDNRPRANAIKALMSMRTSDALAALDRMLSDRRARHRTSALWLVEHLGVLGMSHAVAELAVADPDTNVRDRAGRVIQELIELIEQPTSIELSPDDQQQAPGTNESTTRNTQETAA